MLTPQYFFGDAVIEGSKKAGTSFVSRTIEDMNERKNNPFSCGIFQLCTNVKHVFGVPPGCALFINLQSVAT